MILRGYNLGTLGTSAFTSAPVNRVIVIDPKHPPTFVPSTATVVYRTPSAVIPPAPASVAVQPMPAAQAGQPELIPQYSSTSERSQGLQRPVEIPIEQAVATAPVTAPPDGGSLVPIIAAIILAIVAGQ